MTVFLLYIYSCTYILYTLCTCIIIFSVCFIYQSPQIVIDNKPTEVLIDLQETTSLGTPKLETQNQSANDLDLHLTSKKLTSESEAEMLRAVELENVAPNDITQKSDVETNSKKSRPNTANARLGVEKSGGKQVRIDLRPSRPSTASAGSASGSKSEKMGKAENLEQVSRPNSGFQSNRSRPLTSQRSRPNTGSQRSRFSSPRSRPSSGVKTGCRIVGLGIR